MLNVQGRSWTLSIFYFGNAVEIEHLLLNISLRRPAREKHLPPAATIHDSRLTIHAKKHLPQKKLHHP
jgi:hypothetical protein